MNSLAVKTYLLALQQRIVGTLEALDGSPFHTDSWQRPEGGGGISRVIEEGDFFERGGVNFSHVTGTKLPPSASAHRPEIAGAPWEAMGVSLVLHPRNPYCPTVHMNVCKSALDRFGSEFYPRFKKWCDDYFFLRHRNEPRGIGGIFFDDFSEPGFDKSFALLQSAGDAFLSGYLPIAERRKDTPYGEKERDFQAYRRGRYVEFNLVYDRGTLFGLQSGGRTEAILMSLPPVVNWRYDWKPEAGSAEEKLYSEFLVARDWA